MLRYQRLQMYQQYWNRLSRRDFIWLFLIQTHIRESRRCIWQVHLLQTIPSLRAFLASACTCFAWWTFCCILRRVFHLFEGWRRSVGRIGLHAADREAFTLACQGRKEIFDLSLLKEILCRHTANKQELSFLMFHDKFFVAAVLKVFWCHQNDPFFLLSIQTGSLLEAIESLCFQCLEQYFCLFSRL